DQYSRTRASALNNPFQRLIEFAQPGSKLVLDGERSGLRSERGLDAARITVLVVKNGDIDVAEPRQVVAERVGLRAAELEQERTTAAEEPGAIDHDAAEDIRALGTAVVGQRRLERECVALQQRKCRRRHEGRRAEDDIAASSQRAR